MSSRLVKTGEKGKHITSTIVQCYAPINDSEKENNVMFYGYLQAKLERRRALGAGLYKWTLSLL